MLGTGNLIDLYLKANRSNKPFLLLKLYLWVAQHSIIHALVVFLVTKSSAELLKEQNLKLLRLGNTEIFIPNLSSQF